MLVYIADRNIHGSIKAQPGSAEFGKQDKDAAYKNLWTYIAYARAVSEKESSWKYLQAEFRYERGIQNDFDQLSEVLLQEITEEQFIRGEISSKYVNALRTSMAADLANNKIDSPSAAEGKKKNYIGELSDLVKIGIILSDEFKRFSSEGFLKWMFVDKTEQGPIQAILDKLEKKLKGELMQELDTQFKLIQAGGKVDFNNVSTVMKAISQKYIERLKLLDSYRPFIHEILSIDEPIKKHMEKLKGKLPASKQPEFEFDFLVNSSFNLEFERGKIFDVIATDIANGKTFDPKAKPADTAAIIKKYKEDLDQQFKDAKAKK
jgi:hypothetical protein